MTSDQISPADHRREAAAHLAAAKRVRGELEALYTQPHHDRARVADCHDRIRWHLQVAKIHAALAHQDQQPAPSCGPRSWVNL